MDVAWRALGPTGRAAALNVFTCGRRQRPFRENERFQLCLTWLMKVNKKIIIIPIIMIKALFQTTQVHSRYLGTLITQKAGNTAQKLDC